MKLAALGGAVLCWGLLSAPSQATGLATCNSGPKSGWKSEQQLRDKLTKEGWNIRRIKEDGGCYEVYAIDNRGRRVETYFHPVTFEHILTSTR
jgi:hypothetical protein